MTLYPFQQTGVKFLTTARAAVLADDMGVGKSLQTIAALEFLDAYPALIVCPSSVKASWRAEFAKWAPDRSVAVVSGNVKQRREALASGADVLVMNYESLRAHSSLARYGTHASTDAEKIPKELNALDFRAVVADEAHRIKDPASKQTRALKAAAGKAEYRFALTGTPIANNPADLWSLLNFIAPLEWPRRTEFISRYCLQSWNGFGNEILGVNPRHEEEFFEILDPRFLRRSKALVLPQLPEKTYETRLVEMGARQKKAYAEMEKSYLASVAGGTVMALSPLVQATRLCQFASSCAEMTQAPGCEPVLRLTAPSNKIDGMVELLEDLGSDAQVVVFAEHLQLIDLAAERLDSLGVSYGRVTGDESERERSEAVERFQAGHLRVMLLTLGAGGVGITLTAASVAVFLERSWSMVNNLQAEDRIHRIGQDAERVLIVDLVSPDTIEEHRISRLALKGNFLEEIVRDHETLASYLRKKAS